MKKFYPFFFAIFISTSTNAQYIKLLDFDGTSNGKSPYQNSLISDGTFLYGMTRNGGTNNKGVIFKIKPDGTNYTKLFDFAIISNGTDPAGSLISDGTFLYGMTSLGGINTNCSVNGCGVLFKIKTDGTNYAKLLDFNGSNGSNPFGSLIFDGTFLYGITNYGGTNGNGVVFKIKPDGTNYTKLLDFDDANGKNPKGSLIYDGTFLYGMTEKGGASTMGVIFKIKPDGTNYTKLLDFAGSSNGKWPVASLISDGAFLYGMTSDGGANNYGVIFKIKPDGTNYIKLLDFAGTSNGKDPYGSLISDGAFLYGMTAYGGINGDYAGVLFKIKPDGTGFAKMLDFDGSNGGYPFGSLISDSSFLYGMTSNGGNNDMGTIFKYALLTGIEEKEAENALEIYPNPTSGKFKLQIMNDEFRMMNYEVKIYNVLGEIVQYSTLNIQHSTLIEISNPGSGVYFVQVMSEIGVVVKKMVVE